MEGTVKYICKLPFPCPWITIWWRHFALRCISRGSL